MPIVSQVVCSRVGCGTDIGLNGTWGTGAIARAAAAAPIIRAPWPAATATAVLACSCLASNATHCSSAAASSGVISPRSTFTAKLRRVARIRGAAVSFVGENRSEAALTQLPPAT